MAGRVSDAGRRLTLVLLLLGVGAAATLALGVVGLYGVVAYVVALRSREIGIRIALGLTPAGAVRMLLAHGVIIVCAGVVLGGLGFTAFARLLRTVTYGGDALDLTALASAAAVVAVVATLAVWVPARRAGRVDLRIALGNE